jgi:hypothetical protein
MHSFKRSKYKKLFGGDTMKCLIIIAACSLFAGCGDKDVDTGSDTAEVTDTGEASN